MTIGRGRLGALLVVAALAVTGCGMGAGSAERTPDTPDTTDTTDTLQRNALPGFGETPFEVRTVAGRVAVWCALLADDDASRARGLMGQSGLRGYDAMVFRHPAESTGAYFMYRTVLPLSIAWFDVGGAFVSSTDMSPCPSDDEASCPRYRPAGPYRFAVEVPRGALGDLGIGPGSQLRLIDGMPCGPPVAA